MSQASADRRPLVVRVGRCALPVLLALGVGSLAEAQDVTRPAAVTGVAVARSGADVALSWSPVTVDATGQPETIDHYTVYRGTAPDFVPDRVGGSNRIGTPAASDFTDSGAAADGNDYYYRVGAVDVAGHESNVGPPLVTTPPVLSGEWTNTTIDVEWLPGQPVDAVASYRVYYGKKSGQYAFVQDVGLGTSLSLVGLQKFINWYIAVTALDANGNESAFSNEHIDAVSGVVRLRAHDKDELCWGTVDCVPTDPSKVLRSDGFQLMVPAEFPEGDWVSVSVMLTVESRLCIPPNQGTITKCGAGNPCVSPPCNGGYNPCGDPWDRLVQLFLVLDDCIEAGGSCITPANLELIHAVTPFGTDAPPTAGSGVVPPRTYTMDVTPFASLLTGTKHVGVEIVHFVQKGWWVTVDFTFSERPEQASAEPPAAGVEVIGFSDAPIPTKSVSVPAGATQVKARIFTTGHGGGLFCDGGVNNAKACVNNAQCPGGVCNPCDEFCHRTNQLLLNGSPIWQVVPFRTDCSPSGTPCSQWNACGFPSCTFPRAGWCPGYIACHKNPPCDNDVDLTSLIAPGGTYDFDYTVTPKNGSWPVSVVLYWYE